MCDVCACERERVTSAVQHVREREWGGGGGMNVHPLRSQRCINIHDGGINNII